MAMASTITTRGGPWPINSRTKVAPAPINEKYPHLLLDAGGESRVPGSTTRRAFEAKRSEKLFRVLEYNWIICPIGLVCCFVVSYSVVSRHLLFRTIIDSTTWWTPDTAVCVLLGVASHLAQSFPFGYTVGVCSPINPFEYKKKPKSRSFKSLNFCLVTKGDNFQTVLQTMSNWHELRSIDQRINFHFLLDNELPGTLVGQIPDFVKLVLVPPSFNPPVALYKARALEYMRLTAKHGSDDWVLHLDEETQIDAYATQVCIDFIERGDRHFGMGTILYNSQGHWDNAFLTVGELSRVTADFGRFRLPFKLNARPYLGYVHGSFILVNGEIENVVTWDTDCLAEDFWFGLRAANKGYKFGWLDAIAREQPPRSVRDVCAQRKRWSAGIWSTGEPLARLSYAGCFAYFGALAHLVWVLFLRENPLTIPRWVLVWGMLHCSEGLWSAISSTIAQDYDAGDISALKMIWHVILTFFLSPVFNLMECAVVIHAIFNPPKKFYVVKKV